MTTFRKTRNRPMAGLLAVGLSLCMLLLHFVSLFGCTTRLGVYTTSFLDTFDTVLTVTVGASSREEATRWTTQIHRIARDLHLQFSAYDPSEAVVNVETINRHAGLSESFPISEDLIMLLETGVELYEKTDGKLNICIGTLTGIWKDVREGTAPPPDPAVLEVIRKEQCGIQALELDADASTARLSVTSVRLDVGAIAKGFALNRIRQYAESEGITSLLINFGGQVMAIGCHPDGNPWTVAIRDPRDGSTLDTVSLENAVIATSADDQRSVTLDGVKYHHIIDPDTGYPGRGYRSVSVMLPLEHTSVSDGLSTALFLLEQSAGEALISEYGGSALWLTAEGALVSFQWPHKPN